MLLSATQIHKNYGMKQLLSGVDFYVDSGEKIGVVGINGTGKSTLLRVLSMQEEPDSGEVRLDPNVQVSVLSQNPLLTEDATALEQVFIGFPESFRALNEYEAKIMLERLGIHDVTQKIAALSGGQRKRVALATALIHPADVLILDEPTNHLDTAMIEWLEDWLRHFRGGLVMVTHDRYFLERVCNRICQVENGKLYFYEANYSRYLELREQRWQYAAAAERKRQTILRREYQWIIRGPQARGTKAKDRIRRYQELKDTAAPEEQGTIDIVAPETRLGKETIELIDISKNYDGREILQPFSMRLGRDARIGIVGENGAGKTTLLKIMSGRLMPDTGSVAIGETVRIGMFSQNDAELDLNQRPYDYVKEIAASVHTAAGTFSASQMLEQFMFSGDMQYTTIGALSGGERRRLYLLGVLMSAPNVLMLDEPTNDLDVETLAILEEYLAGFNGILITVSHDRYFLDKVVDEILEVRTGGEIRRYAGSYTDYLEKRPQESSNSVQAKAMEEKSGPAPRREKKLRFSYQEQREYEHIDDEIAAVEAELASIEKEISSCGSDYVKLQELTALQDEKNALLEQKMDRWVYLNDLAEQIAAQG